MKLKEIETILNQYPQNRKAEIKSFLSNSLIPDTDLDKYYSWEIWVLVDHKVVFKQVLDFNVLTTHKEAEKRVTKLLLEEIIRAGVYLYR